ncbi:ABC transporter permease [Algoriphagus sp. D3-2-R+10]|uniref:ABC transporter permease n=1 Tax=Algoriphagus aurantiacus TaxID=3103948 RepID=UPI002B3BCA13|nr:ABC transporter permease [Algoriphagus sp. D3-2-R+10]MEB2775074.1 ABC transporter permease [Algoriphagus sp. D3-2-R+10]
MLKNYLKIAFRHLWKDRLYSLINIVGLAAATMCLILAVVYWNDEHSFDDFHANNPNLYRVTTTFIEKKGADPKTVGVTGQVQGPAFREAVPEVKNYSRVMGGEIYNDISTDEKTLRLKSLFVDDSFFDVFSFSLINGVKQTALKEINSVVISESTALRLFNSTNVVGEVLQMNSDPSYQRLKKPLVISAVAKDPPKNSSIQFDILLPFDFLGLSFKDTNWLNAYLGTFVVLQPNSDLEDVKQKFNRVFATYAKEQLSQNIARYGFDSEINYGLQKITEVHLQPRLSINDFNGESGIGNSSNPIYSIVFLVIALLILLMAAINFINISLANSLNRVKEIGIRKIAGGNRSQIIFQYLIESGLLCGFSFIISLLALDILLPLFNNLTGKQIIFSEIFGPQLVLSLVLIFGFIISLTGFYPAFVLSNFRASEVLYNKLRSGGRNLVGRGLVVLQFSLGIFLLISSIVIHSQMEYIRTKSLGYNPNQIVQTSITGNRDYEAVWRLLKEELSQESSIESVSSVRNSFSENVKVDDQKIESLFQAIDENYLTAVEIPILLGRNFSSDFQTDFANSAIVNEAFINESDLNDPIGKTIKLNEAEAYSEAKTIIGVVKDFHFGSLRESIKPMVLSMSQIPYGQIVVKFEKSRGQEAIAALEKAYKKAMPDAVFEYDFLDELNAQEYVQEQRWQKIVNTAASLSFIICCFGLFSMAHLSANQRIKEIGVRKVLGATVSEILILLSANFLKLILISFVIAAPIAWYTSNYWLQDYAYRIDLTFGIFAFAGFASLVVGATTISLQAIRAALMNPVESLKSE